MGGEFCESVAHRFGRVGNLLRHVDVGLVVAGFAGEQALVERFEFGFFQRFGEKLHTLATTRFDEREDEKRIHGSARLVGPYGLHQFPSVGAGALVFQRNAASLEVAQE